MTTSVSQTRVRTPSTDTTVDSESKENIQASPTQNITAVFTTVIKEGVKICLNEIAIPYVARAMDPKTTPYPVLSTILTGIQLTSAALWFGKIVLKKDSSLNQILQDSLYYGTVLFNVERIRREIINPYL